MNAFAEVDRWRALNERRPPVPGGGPWRAFVKVGELRFRAQVNGTRIQVQRRCYYRPGAWRVAGWVFVERFVASCAEWGLTPAQAEAVLVLRDRWLECGARVVARPPVVAS